MNGPTPVLEFIAEMATGSGLEAGGSWELDGGTTSPLTIIMCREVATCQRTLWSTVCAALKRTTLEGEPISATTVTDIRVHEVRSL